ncbi:MAG: biopolymer transporter ExbD [Spirochaetaceae bacterium]|nr:biopolymer transporter ExbD [Spirochaetaceae bacterium]
MLDLGRWDRQSEEMEVNITSMIDVIFILLIFFMVSTQFKRNSLPLDLPRSENSSQQETVLVLSVTDTAMELDGSLLSMDELEPRLTERHSQNPDLTLSLECHKSVEFQRVVDVLTRIQAAGISRIGIVHEAVD